MANSSNRRITARNAILIYIEALAVSVLVLAIITLVAGRFPNSVQKSPILTFDTSSVKTQLAKQGISNPGNIQDWYEPHYLSVCKGMWQSAGTHIKNEASKSCTVMGGGYRFSLPELLAADTGLHVDSPPLSTWSFAVLNTKTPFVWLVIAVASTSLTVITYFITIITTPTLTTESPLLLLMIQHALVYIGKAVRQHLLPRVGYIASILALNALIVSSAKITVMMHKLLETRLVVENGVAWSTGGFYVLTWLATGLMCVTVTLSVVLAFMLRPPTSSQRGELDRKGSGYSHVQ